MTNQEFEAQFDQWASTGCTQLLSNIPSGSGICRTLDVEPKKYSVAYVSTNPGSFKKSNESGNWYAPYFDLAKIEGRITDDCIYEYSRVGQDTPVIDGHKMPQVFIDAIYQDRELPTGLYDKSQIVIDIIRKYLPQTQWSGAYFPSRRGDGGIFMTDRNQVPMDTIYTGSRPPKPEEIGSV